MNMNDPIMDFNIQINEDAKNTEKQYYKPINQSIQQQDKVLQKDLELNNDQDIEKLREKYNTNFSGDYTSNEDDLTEQDTRNIGENQCENNNDSTQGKIKAFFMNNKLTNLLTDTAFDINQSANPFTCFLASILKIMSLFVYFFVGGTIFKFSFVIMLTAIDFWALKNYHGKKLVGLFWWTQSDSQNKQIFKFESNPDFVPNKIDYNFFWLTQIITTILWGLFVFANFITFHWITCILDVLVTFVNGSNLYYFYKCRGSHQQQVQTAQTGLIQSTFQKVVLNKSFSLFNGSK